jgi:alanine racemase
MIDTNRAGAILTVDLQALAENYAFLKGQLGGNTICAAVVKSDAYGLGLEPIAVRLAHEGCNSFFVAVMDEAISLRTILKQHNKRANIYLLSGVAEGSEGDLDQFDLTPVLNSLAEIERWSSHAKTSGKRKAILNLDTGMSRLGLDTRELATFANKPELADGVEITYVMSHLACADDRASAKNQEQLSLFNEYRTRLGLKKASFANSAGILLGPEYHYNLVRPGAAIYGIQPITNEINKISQVIGLKGKILQLRTVDTGETVGYGATYQTPRTSRLATVAAGYGDGYFRTLGNRGFGYIGTTRVPVVGRVSMDLITFDVTDLPEHEVVPGAMIELIGPHYSVDKLAEDAGTIGYEILTGLGARYSRNYIGSS